MERRRLPAAVLAVADAVLVVAGVLVALTRAGSDRVAFSAAGDVAPSRAAAPAPRRAPVTAADVLGRPEPERVMAKGRWQATLDGSADRLVFHAPIVVDGRAERTTIGFTTPDPRPQARPDGSVRHLTGTALAVPDGSRWYPVEPFRVDTQVAVSGASAAGPELAGRTTLAGLVGSRGVSATGRFVTRDGREVTELRLSPGTRLSPDCAGPDPSQAPTPCPGPSTGDLPVRVEAGPGLRIDIDSSNIPGYDGNGEGAVEVEVAGTVRARALNREWTGLVGSLEADDVSGTAVWDGAAWTVEVRARSARQVWIDVWPVVDTVLEATSGYDGGPHSCTGDCSVRLRYRNAGYATAQIFEAEARGGANAVALGIKQTGTHDAGLGVHRGGHEVNLRSGRGVDSHLPPGDSHDRGLTFTPGVPVTLVLRGNFPEERVTLAVPASRA